MRFKVIEEFDGNKVGAYMVARTKPQIDKFLKDERLELANEQKGRPCPCEDKKDEPCDECDEKKSKSNKKQKKKAKDTNEEVVEEQEIINNEE